MKIVKEHSYAVGVVWKGNAGVGTSSYTAYKRDHEVQVTGKPPIPCSSDPAFRGDPSRYNPEELLVATISACHMLWYLHLCADAGIIVTEYQDNAMGTMVELDHGGGHFTEVLLQPQVTVKGKVDSELCHQLHEKAHALCFIASSVNFSVRCMPAFTIDEPV
ncbi:MAG TPA: OsmC family protein [Acidobacteriota bacterium]|nr:OsmC family protein [Acidobacteriota bacterium]